MTTKAIKNKVIEYFNNADEQVIEAVYKILKLYEDADSKSLMSTLQKKEIDKRSLLFKQGKVSSSTWEEVKKRLRKS